MIAQRRHGLSTALTAALSMAGSACAAPPLASPCATHADCPDGYRCDPQWSFCFVPPARDRAAPGDAGPADQAATASDINTDALSLDRGGASDLRPPDVDRDLQRGDEGADVSTLDAGAVGDASADAARDASLDRALPADNGPRPEDAGRPALDSAVEDVGLSFEPYRDEFSTDTGVHYVPYVGAWQSAEGVLSQTQACASDCSTYHYREHLYADLRAEVDFRKDQPCGGNSGQISLAVRLVEHSAGCNRTLYACLVDTSASLLYALQWYGSCSTTGSSVPTPALASGTWYHLSADMIGTQLRCELSGGPLGESVTNAATFTAIPYGHVGVATSGAAASYDNLVIEPY